MVQPPDASMPKVAQPGAPVGLALNAPLEVANWRPLVHWLLAIPHFLIIYVLSAVNSILVFISFWAILFTKKIPRGMFDFMVMTLRYQWRVTTFYLFMREPYPPFDFDPGTTDNGADLATLTIEYPGEVNRFLPLIKWFLIIPHAFVLVFLFLGALFAWIFAFLAVLFTGKYPEGVRNYFLGLARWVLRVQAYMNLLRDEYPPFSLS